MSEQTQEQIDAYNRRELWRDAANHLTTAYESTEQAQGLLEDLGRTEYADQLQPLVDALRRAATEAEEQRTQ